MSKERNWFLVFISLLMILIGGALLIISIAFATDFGWWSLLVGLGGASTVFMAIMSIIKNDPSWILLDLILPS